MTSLKESMKENLQDATLLHQKGNFGYLHREPMKVI